MHKLKNTDGLRFQLRIRGHKLFQRVTKLSFNERKEEASVAMIMRIQHSGVWATLRRSGASLDMEADDVAVNRFITPGLSMNFNTNLLPEQQDSNLPFNLNTSESGAAGDDWMMMNSQGSFW